MQRTNNRHPLILAPAGNKASFLAALAAGADAVYCGLKNFSARMGAKNFSVEELAPLSCLAREKGTEVYIALNSLIKQDDLNKAGKLLDQLNQQVRPKALIVQDLSFLELARQTGFPGEIHLSTLAAVTFPSALKLIRERFHPKITRVVLPRELNIDEIRAVASACPRGPELEVFVHGALCYGLSGRCYWSSYMGGKSGLRGRCVQPCRRVYLQKDQQGRFFSCQDMSLDVLVKVLLSVPQIRAWKIEGRKKGPHYVFHTVTAYKLLRDHGTDPQMKKTAVKLLARALGRAGTHYRFLPQRPQNPVNTGIHTGSGLLVGRVRGSQRSPYIVPGEELLSGDMLRIGYEDEHWHCTQRVRRHVPKKGRLDLKLSADREASGVSGHSPWKNAPVFLTDRREKALGEMLTQLEDRLRVPAPVAPSKFNAGFPKKFREKTSGIELRVSRHFTREALKARTGLWITENLPKMHLKTRASGIWWWLPPVIWPNDEEKWKSRIESLIREGGRDFVLNAPWQMIFFRNQKKMNLWAGPFCNFANTPAIEIAADMGFSGVIVSPELTREDFLKLPGHSPLPLGIVISGNWPLCVSRILPDDLNLKNLFSSPKGEQAWAVTYESDTWLFPNWAVDLSEKKAELRNAGYTLFVHLAEALPKNMRLKKRPGMWNWDLKLF